MIQFPLRKPICSAAPRQVVLPKKRLQGVEQFLPFNLVSVSLLGMVILSHVVLNCQPKVVKGARPGSLFRGFSDVLAFDETDLRSEMGKYPFEDESDKGDQRDEKEIFAPVSPSQAYLKFRSQEADILAGSI